MKNERKVLSSVYPGLLKTCPIIVNRISEVMISLPPGQRCQNFKVFFKINFKDFKI